MKKSGTERKIIILAMFIVLAVGISGYLVNSSLKQIVNSIHNEASTDYRLIVIKNISLDLLEIENSIQLYRLTKNKSNLENYNKVNKRLSERLVFLSNLKAAKPEQALLNDSVRSLLETKLEIWEEIRQINVVKNDPEPQFEELYSMLEKKEIDTVKVEVRVEPPKKKGLFKKIFGKKDTVTTRIDTNYIERTVENEEIKKEIEELETDLQKEERRKNRRELALIQQNILVTEKLNKLVTQIEKAERDGLIEKNDEADQLATIIYKRLSAFSIAAVVLLFIVLYLFLRYLQKSRKVQKTLIGAKQGAERLAKAKEVFIANVSHEMRTPVNAIHGIAEQLLQEKTNKNIREKHGILLKSSKHLKDVVNDTLDFSKIAANKLKVQSIDFAPDDVIKEVLTILRPEARTKNIQLIYRGSNKMPDALLGDPFRLKQILINIIGNAIKFTENGNVTIGVESKEVTKNMFRLKFIIKDTGIGISEENIEHVFEDFVQIETDYTRKFGGTGLGLSIVKKLIDIQKGGITINSEIDIGTKVSFYIPYELGTPEKIDRATPQDIIVSERVRNYRVLVVDDDEYNRIILKAIFDKWGLKNYNEAVNGNEAVELALNKNFDFILMDIRMPELNGIEASKIIVKEKPQSKIVALATLNSESEMKICKEAGMKTFLSKPFSEEELLNTILLVMNDNVSVQNERDAYNLKELERLANGDRAFMKEMILIFTRSTDNGITTIKAALKTKNWLEISEVAHKMTAQCKHINANELYEKFKRLEAYTRNKQDLKQVPDLITNIEKKVKAINKSLSVLIESGTLDK